MGDGVSAGRRGTAGMDVFALPALAATPPAFGAALPPSEGLTQASRQGPGAMLKPGPGGMLFMHVCVGPRFDGAPAFIHNALKITMGIATGG